MLFVILLVVVFVCLVFRPGATLAIVATIGMLIYLLVCHPDFFGNGNFWGAHKTNYVQGNNQTS